MKFFKWLVGKKTICSMCGADKMGDRPGCVIMFHGDLEEPLEQEICTKCSDDLDQECDETMQDLNK